MILVTGCAGFIGSHFVLDWALEAEPLLGLDKLTYAGNLQNLAALQDNPRFLFVRGDIGDREGVAALLVKHRPRAIVNFAAESHVDRSIHGPEAFLQTNVVGTAHLLEAALAYYETLSGAEQEAFRFLHVSTDEVYGSLGPEDPPFTEENPIRPNSPYSASKASSDAFVRAWHETFGLPTLITNCSNNYGPLQFTEKLIPLMIWNALQGKPLPVYGDGQNVRDWLYVSDHCAALRLVLEKGRVGETYNIGGHNEIKNIDIVNKICSLIDQIRPSPAPHCGLISFVKDRLGHDRRYAIDASKIERKLGWRPRETFETGIEKTVRWYLDHEAWMRDVSGGAYLDWIKTNYGAFASGEGELS